MFACRHHIINCLSIISLMVLASHPMLSRADSVPATAESSPTPCGIVEKSAGEAFVMDSSRSHVDEAKEGRLIACGSWVSTTDGWVEVRHRNGHLIRVSRTSFVQFQIEDSDFNVFRGVVHVQAFGDSKPAIALSPNGRAKLKMGSGLFIYSPERQSTQWVVLDQVGSLENRFEPGTEITVREGESSTLDLSRPRVVPQEPRAITVASLKPILKDLALSDKKASRAVRVALERQRRVFPSDISLQGEGSIEARSPASVAGEPVVQEIYRRHPVDKHAVKLEKEFRKRVLRGTAKVSHKSSRAAEAEALESRLARKAEKDQEERRNRLLRELERMPASK